MRNRKRDREMCAREYMGLGKKGFFFFLNKIRATNPTVKLVGSREEMFVGKGFASKEHNLGKGPGKTSDSFYFPKNPLLFIYKRSIYYCYILLCSCTMPLTWVREAIGRRSFALYSLFNL